MHFIVLLFSMLLSCLALANVPISEDQNKTSEAELNETLENEASPEFAVESDVESSLEDSTLDQTEDSSIASNGDEELVETVVSEPYFDDYGWDDDTQASYEEDSTEYELPPEIVLPELPGEEIKYKLKLHKYNHHDLHGRADSEIGKLKFKSKLMPSNEVKMDIKLKGEEEVLFKAYLDLANYTMELDGGGAILDSDQKTLMKYTAEHLRQRLIKKFKDEIPDHSFMTVQMLTYWSKSPDGYAHAKRDVVSN